MINTVSEEAMDITDRKRREGEMLSWSLNIQKNSIAGKALSLIISFKRASPLFSFCLKGSMALEGCLVLPVFMLFMATLLYGIEVVRFQSDLYEAVHQTGSEICFLAYQEEYGASGGKNIKAAEGEIKHWLGEQLLPFLCVEGGREGIQITADERGRGNMEIRVSCSIKPLIRTLPLGNIIINDRYYGHGFVGYTGETGSESGGKEIYVYVTPSGSRYHLSEDCRYLKVRIQAVMGEKLEEQRNSSGGRYYPCDLCRPGREGLVYLTEWGDRYHGSPDCSSIKRTVFIIPLSEAGNRTACSSCG